MTVKFKPGRNIAMKVPPHQYEQTVAFYRDVLGLEVLPEQDPQIGFRYGDQRLWIDSVPALSQAEIWLEVVADDLDAAARHLAASGIHRCDAIEPLPPDFKGFWIVNPAGIVHMVAGE